MKEIRFSILKVGIGFHARQFWKYKTFYIIPGVTIEANNNDYWANIQIELNILCFGLGIKFFRKK